VDRNNEIKPCGVDNLSYQQELSTLLWENCLKIFRAILINEGLYLGNSLKNEKFWKQ
jgi:hypothetical protein